MVIDEKKLIESIEKKSTIFNDYTSLARFNLEYQTKKRQQKLVFGSIFLVGYIIVAFSILFMFKDNTTVLFWPFEKPVDSNQLDDLQKQVLTLSKETEDVKIALASPQNNASVKYLDNRLSALEQSISLNPEKALTAVLLREKQKNLEENFSELRSEQARLDSKVDNFFITVIIAPVAVAILGFLGWFIKGRFKKDTDQ